MKKKLNLTDIAAILILFLLLLVIPVNSLDGYNLVFNETFEDNDITEYTKVTGSGTFAVAASGCAKGTYCLQYTAADSNGILLNLANQSTNKSNSENYIIKAYIMENAGGGTRAYTGLTFNTNNAGSACDALEYNTGTQLEVEALTCAGLPRQGTDINLSAGTLDAWYWIVINITENNRGQMYFYTDDTESSLIFEHQNFWRGNLSLLTGKIGFFGHRNTGFWDNVLIYNKSGIASPASFLLNTTLINNSVISTNLEIRYNATFQNTNNFIFNCSFLVNGTINASSLNIRLNDTQTFNFTPQNGIVKHYFQISCENEELNTTTGKYFYTFVTSSIDEFCELAYNNTEDIKNNLMFLAIIALNFMFLWLMIVLFKGRIFTPAVLTGFLSLGLDFILTGYSIHYLGQGFPGYVGQLIGLGMLIFTLVLPVTKVSIIALAFKIRRG